MGGGHPAPPHPFILQICVLSIGNYYDYEIMLFQKKNECSLETHRFKSLVSIKGDVEFDVQNRNSSIVFLYMKSKCANFAFALLDQQDNIRPLKATKSVRQ